MNFLETIYTEMCKGNFSFAILIGNLLTVAIMIIERRKK